MRGQRAPKGRKHEAQGERSEPWVSFIKNIRALEEGDSRFSHGPHGQKRFSFDSNPKIFSNNPENLFTNIQNHKSLLRLIRSFREISG